MIDRNFKPPAEKNGLLHPPSCACVKCAAGRESQELDAATLERVNEMLETSFLQVVQGNYFAACQALSQGQQIGLVRGAFQTSIANALMVREMAAAYFAAEKPEEE